DGGGARRGTPKEWRGRKAPFPDPEPRLTMLVVNDLAKHFTRDGRTKRLFSNLSFTLDSGERLAVLGRNGQGKSTLIKILGGILAPNAGEVTWSMTASWPLGFSGGFQGGLTGFDNIHFLARIYDREFEPIAAR